MAKGHSAVHDTGLLTRVLEHKVPRIAASRKPGEVDEILHWVGLLHEEDPASAVAVAGRLEQLLGHLDAGGLARWILGGLRRYPNEPVRQRAYFSLDDPRAVESLHGEAAAEDLDRALPTLGMLATGLLGRDIAVQPHKQAALNAPPLRPIVTGSHVLLPDSYTTLDGGDRYRLYRAAVAHAVAHLRHSPIRLAATTLKPMAIAVVSAVEDARVERLLAREMPGLRGWFLEFVGCRVNRADLGFASLVSRMSRALMDDAYDDDNHWVNKARELFAAHVRSQGLEEYEAFRRIASVLANDLGQMRVRFSPQQYAVPEPHRDDNSILWDYGDPKTPPPEALTLVSTGGRIVQRDTASTSADAAPAQEEELARFSYPEWDHRIERERLAWCTVVEKRPARPSARPHVGPSALGNLERVVLPRSRTLSRRRRLRRQQEGDDIDLNAAIEVYVDRSLDRLPDGRLFLRPGNEERCASIIVLLDISESANDRVGGTMQSILDIEKLATAVLVRSVWAAGDRIAVRGFSSDTREKVSYVRLLDFGAPHDDDSLAALWSTQASQSTRMGAAIRHAAQELSTRKADQRAIIVVTDGAPSDIDVFDPDYLVEDAHAAVRSAGRKGVQCHCVAVDAAADAYVKHIFGTRNYRIVESPHDLPAHLSSLYARLAVR